MIFYQQFYHLNSTLQKLFHFFLSSFPFLFFQVILLRARPILNIATRVENITQIDANREGCREDSNSKLPCFVIEPCFQLLNPPKGKSVLQLRYVIEAESFLESMFILFIN